MDSKDTKISTEDVKRVIEFHGHNCPGLAIGIRVSELCLRELGHNSQSTLVAICETDMCGVDAIQFLTGCSVGKGNLLLLDHGKMVFTFFCRSDSHGFRAMLKPEALGQNGSKMFELMKRKQAGVASSKEIKECDAFRDLNELKYLEAELDELFELSKPQMNIPRPAKILDSIFCDTCGEKTMESRLRIFDGKVLCISCFNQVEQKICI